MLKLAVAFAVGSLLFCPIVAVAAETASRMNGSATAEFLQGRTNSLFGIDAPRQFLNQEKEKSYSVSPYIEFSPIHKIDRGSMPKGFVPIKLNSSEDAGCNGTSVEDFLKGKCNKLHGFDARLNERGNGKLPPTWGEDQFKPAEPYTFDRYGGANLRPSSRYGFDNHDSHRNQKPLGPGDFEPHPKGFPDFGLPSQHPMAK